MNPKHIRRGVGKRRRQLDQQFHTVWLEASGQPKIGNYKELPSAGLRMQDGALGGNTSICEEARSPAVIGRGLALQVLAVLQRDFHVVWDDFILAWSLEKQHVVQGDTRKMFQSGTRLNGVVDLVLLFC